jgi:hypothetical protein
MKQQSQWNDLPAAAKRRLGVMAVVQVALLAAALWDIRRRPAQEIKGSKGMWVALSFINFVGPIAYFLFGRKSNKRLILPFVSIALFLSGCGLVALQGSGNVITESRDVSNSERVEVCCGIQLILTQGSPEQLALEGDDNILPEIETVVRGETLSVRFRSTLGPLHVRPSRPIIVNLQMPSIRGIDISGGGSLETETLTSDRVALKFSGGSQGWIGGLEAERVELEASGGGEVVIGSLSAQTLNVHASGGGDVTIETGAATEQDVTVSGGSYYRAAGLESETTTLEVSGGSEVQVWVTETLDVQASGGSDVEYTGSPAIEQQLSGGSEMRSVVR